MDPEGYPIPQSDSWIPSNLNLSAQGVMVEEARAEGSAWSPSYLNLNLSEECVCPPGQPMIESPQNREQERVPSLRFGESARTVGEGDVQQSNYLLAHPTSDLLTCTCPQTQGGGEDDYKVLSATPSKETREEPHFEEAAVPTSGPTYAFQERCLNVCPGICKGPDAQPSLGSHEGRGLSTPLGVTSPAISTTRGTGGDGQSEDINDKFTHLEDVYIWEARSYTGSAESDEMEKLRLEGKSEIPKCPGDRSEENIGDAGKREENERKNISPSSDETNYKGGQDNPENTMEYLEDVYVWEARSYTGSADSDAQEQLRLAGNAPIPKCAGERSEEDVGGGRNVTDDVYITTAPQCSLSRGTTPNASRTQIPDGAQRRPCGCRVSAEKLNVQQAAQGKGVDMPQKRPCHCSGATDANTGAPVQCVCKHCKKKLLQGGVPPPYEQATSGTSLHTPGAARQQQTGQLVVCPPCTTQTQFGVHDTSRTDESSECQCFCKPSVQDRVQFLTKRLIEGVSPLNEALDTIHMKMKAMGLLGNGLKSKNKGTGTGPHGASGGGGVGSRSAGGRQDPSNPAKGSEPSVAIYIMSPGTVLSPMATKIHPPPPEILQPNSTLQVENATSTLGPFVEEYRDHSDGNIQVPCCELPCCPQRHISPQAHSKP